MEAYSLQIDVIPLEGEATTQLPSQRRPFPSLRHESPEAFKSPLYALPYPWGQAHVHSNDGKGDPRKALNNGTVGFPGIAKELKELGWDGIVILPPLPPSTVSKEMPPTSSFKRHCLPARLPKERITV